MTFTTNPIMTTATEMTYDEVVEHLSHPALSVRLDSDGVFWTKPKTPMNSDSFFESDEPRVNEDCRGTFREYRKNYFGVVYRDHSLAR